MQDQRPTADDRAIGAAPPPRGRLTARGYAKPALQAVVAAATAHVHGGGHRAVPLASAGAPCREAAQEACVWPYSETGEWTLRQLVESGIVDIRTAICFGRYWFAI